MLGPTITIIGCFVSLQNTKTCKSTTAEVAIFVASRKKHRAEACGLSWSCEQGEVKQP